MNPKKADHAITISSHTWAEARSQARPVRETVFIVEQHVPKVLEWDEEDENATHFLALLAQQGDSGATTACIGTARLLPSAQIGRMAVLQKWRRYGVGKRLVIACENEASAKGLKAVFLHAQLCAKPFYTALHYQPEGEIFMDANIPHVLMSKTLD